MVMNMQDKQVAYYIKKLKEGDFLEALKFTNYIIDKYKETLGSIGGDALLPLCIYELCKTDITQEDLDCLDLFIKLKADYFPDYGEVDYALLTLQQTASAAVKVKNSPDFKNVKDSIDLSNVVKIKQMMHEDSAFSKLEKTVLNNAPAQNQNIDSPLKEQISNATDTLKDNLKTALFKWRKKSYLGFSMFEPFSDLEGEKNHGGLSANSSRLQVILNNISEHPSFAITAIKKAETPTAIALMLDQKIENSTLYDFAIKKNQFSVAHELTKKYEELVLTVDSDPKKNPELEHLLHCNKILAETNKLRALGEQMILKLIDKESKIYEVKGAFKSLRENTIQIDKFKEQIAIILNGSEVSTALQIIEKADKLEKCVNQYKFKNITTSNNGYDHFEPAAKKILNENISFKSTILTRILDRIRNAINSTPEYRIMKQQEKISSAVSALPTQREMKKLLSQMRSEEPQQNESKTTFSR